MDWIYKHLKLNNKRLCMLLTALCILIAYVKLTIQAENNDDPGMMMYISGFYSGKPGILPYIMGAPYTFIISRLYMLTTAVPWYGISFIIINTLAVLTILEKILRSKCTFKRYIFFMCLFIALFLYQLVDLQFTKVAGLAGCAAVILLYDDNIGLIKTRDIVLAAVFAFLSFNIRYQCGYVAIVIMIYMALCNLILSKKWNKKQVLGIVVCIFTVVLSYIANRCYVNNTGWKQYEQLNSQRSLFMDTEKIPFENNESLYENVGWDEDIYYLITHWNFMVDEASQDAFETINNANSGNTIMNRLNIKVLYSSALEFVNSLRIESFFFLLWFILLAIILTLEIKDKGFRLKYVLEAIGYFCLAIGLVFYLLLYGRYNSRTIIMILNLCLVPSIYTLIIMPERKMSNGIGKWITHISFACIMILAMVNGTKKLSSRSEYTYEKWDSVFAYVTDHRENIYVGDYSMTDVCDLFKTFTNDTAPTNYFFWGGWLAESPFDHEHMSYNNLEHLTLEDMLDSNHFFVGNEYYIEKLLNYYQKRHGDVEVHTYYEGEDYIVYGFRKKE